jgi:hypothetical protein
LGEKIVTFDSEKYREQVADALTKITGKAVTWCPDFYTKDMWVLGCNTQTKGGLFGDLLKGINSTDKITLKNEVVPWGGATGESKLLSKRDVKVSPNLKAEVPTAAGNGQYTDQAVPFEIVLWHELVGHAILQKDHPYQPWNIWKYGDAKVKPAGWGMKSDPTIEIENQARTALGLPLRRAVYWDK